MREGTDLDDIRKARQDLDAVIEEIQAVPGYAGFLTAPTLDDIAEAAQSHPLVYLAAAEQGGLALVVRGHDIDHIRLDALTSSAVREQVTEHFAIYEDYANAADMDAHRRRWVSSLDQVTRWLWDTAMGPVLQNIGQAPAIAIVAGGLLGLFPLHAAWTPDTSLPTGRRYALDLMPISYAPNARSLTAARAIAAETSPSQLLAVAEPWPVPASRLPFARHEALIAAAAFPSHAKVLPGGEATTLSFEHQATNADVLHLACHGFAELSSPLDSGLLLADGRFTVRRLLDMRLRVRLAVLSACETALPGTDLPDEVIALPTGLLQAGVAGVVASQWSVPDRATAMLMTEFYRCWRSEQMSPAAALRAAQRWQRDTTNQEKIDHLETAAAEHAAWLPPTVAKDLLDGLYYLEPDQRDHSDLHSWAAFAHVGA